MDLATLLSEIMGNFKFEEDNYVEVTRDVPFNVSFSGVDENILAKASEFYGVSGDEPILRKGFKGTVVKRIGAQFSSLDEAEYAITDWSTNGGRPLFVPESYLELVSERTPRPVSFPEGFDIGASLIAVKEQTFNDIYGDKLEPEQLDALLEASSAESADDVLFLRGEVVQLESYGPDGYIRVRRKGRPYAARSDAFVPV